MISAKVTKNFDLSKIKLDLSRELNQGIDIVAENIEEGIDNSQQFGAVFEKNEKSTLDQKRRKGQGSKPLIATGLLKDESKMVKTKATTAKQEATLLPHPDREDVALWNDQGTDNIPARPHWGISTRADDKIDKIIDKKIRKAIDRSRRARIA